MESDLSTLIVPSLNFPLGMYSATWKPRRLLARYLIAEVFVAICIIICILNNAVVAPTL